MGLPSHGQTFIPPAVSAAGVRRAIVRVEVEQQKCVAAGQCAAAAPEVFDQRDEDGIVVLLEAAPAAADEEGVRYAAAICPAQAIQVHG
jgi:ferredoxin